MAVNCLVVPLAIDGLAGVTAIESKEALVTVSCAEPETEPEVAVMVMVPPVTPLARPAEPLSLEIVAMGSADEVQVTVAVRSWVELSK